jgi:hypothetical protein
MSEYTQQAEDFLKKHNLEFRVVLIGNDCPKFCEDARKDVDMDKVNTFPRRTHLHGKHYRCTISGQGRGHVSFDFWNSYQDELINHARKHGPYRYDDVMASIGFGKGQGTRIQTIIAKYPQTLTPTAYDLLACLEKNEPGTFEEFCSDFGYDTDSRRAEETWRAVTEEYIKVRRFFKPDELEELQEIN